MTFFFLFNIPNSTIINFFTSFSVNFPKTLRHKKLYEVMKRLHRLVSIHTRHKEQRQTDTTNKTLSKKLDIRQTIADMMRVDTH